jgi:hypothetical protein
VRTEADTHHLVSVKNIFYVEVYDRRVLSVLVILTDRLVVVEMLLPSMLEELPGI